MAEKRRSGKDGSSHTTSRRNFIAEAGVGVVAGGVFDLDESRNVSAAVSSAQGASTAGQFNVMNFGAKGDGVADDTKSIQSAINAIGPNGGTVLIPAGTYKCTESLNLNGKQGLHLLGTGGSQSDSQPTIIYTGAGDANSQFISVKSAYGIEFRNLHVRVVNSNFKGVLVNADNARAGETGPGFGFAVFDYCMFSGPIDNKALVRLNATTNAALRNCRFNGGTVGLLGRDGSFCSAVVLDNCTFVNQAVAAIKNAGESWLIQSCTFEPLADGRLGIYTQDLSYNALSFNFINNWAGDVLRSGGVGLRLRAIGGHIAGNFFYQGPIDSTYLELHLCETVSITGNFLFGGGQGSAAIKIASRCFGVHLAGNKLAMGPGILNQGDIIGAAFLANIDGGGGTYPNTIAGNVAINGNFSTNGDVTVLSRTPHLQLSNNVDSDLSARVSAPGEADKRAAIGPDTNTALVLTTAGKERARLNEKGLWVAGNLTVAGALTKSSGAFLIDHPLDAERKQLYHGFVEAPRYDLIYRGRVQLKCGRAVVDIDTASNMTSGTFAALTQNAQFQPPYNETSFAKVMIRPGSLSGGQFELICEDANSNDYVSWSVIAERADAFIKQSYNVDAHGRLIPEHRKSASTPSPHDSLEEHK